MPIAAVRVWRLRVKTGTTVDPEQAAQDPPLERSLWLPESGRSNSASSVSGRDRRLRAGGPRHWRRKIPDGARSIRDALCRAPSAN
jgi:hypothetical protein